MYKLVLIAVVLFVAGCSESAKPGTCPDGFTLCESECAQTTSDPANCGACGKKCAAGQICSAGACSTVCPAGQLMCSGACVDPQTSRNHCGATTDCQGANAGATCVAGQVCASGSCALSCPAGLLDCAGTCVDPLTSRAHCGAAADCQGANTGATCVAGQVCAAGSCALSCPAGLLDCAGTCVDPLNSRAHCGASADCQGANAGATCVAGQVCAAGSCALSCPAGLLDCAGTCVDPLNSRAHCGASADCQGANAGATCTAGQVCAAGACVLSCPAGLLACGGTCINPVTSLEFCGASGDCQGTGAGTACGANEVCMLGDCLADDPSLTGLVTSAGDMLPAFAPGRTFYHLACGLGAARVSFTPTAASPGSIVEVNGEVVVSGAASTPVLRNWEAVTDVEIVVTAPSGATRTYWVTIDHPVGTSVINLKGAGAMVMDISLGNDTLVAGDYHAQDPGMPIASGDADVFVRDSGGGWSKQATLKASNPDLGDQFGFSVSLSGDTIAVSAIGERSLSPGVNADQTDNSGGSVGAVYVFVRDAAGAWSQQAYIKASDPIDMCRFGQKVALDGDTLVVGRTCLNSTVPGAAYVFVRDVTGAWSQQARLEASNASIDDFFGGSVAVEGDGLAVGAMFEASAATGVNGDQADKSAPEAGAAYVFARDASGVWSQQAYLKASNTDKSDRFGTSLSLLGETLVVGALGEASTATGVNGDQANNDFFGTGAAYVFVRDGANGWSQRAYVKSARTNSAYSANFGSSVSLLGETLAVASGSSGIVDLYSRDSNAQWSPWGLAEIPGSFFRGVVSVAGNGGLAVGTRGASGPNSPYIWISR
ncbi:MAG TPA: cadherin-like beta sandwich domain-containing protein [Myxococcales bacterium]